MVLRTKLNTWDTKSLFLTEVSVKKGNKISKQTITVWGKK